MSESGPLQMDADALNAFLGRAFPEGDPALMPRIIEVEEGRVLLRQGFFFTSKK